MADSNGDRAIHMAQEAINAVFEKYPDANCGDWLSFVSAIIVNVAEWIAPAVNEKPENVMSACYTGAITYFDSDGKHD